LACGLVAMERAERGLGGNVGLRSSAAPPDFLKICRIFLLAVRVLQIFKDPTQTPLSPFLGNLHQQHENYTFQL